MVTQVTPMEKWRLPHVIPLEKWRFPKSSHETGAFSPSHLYGKVAVAKWSSRWKSGVFPKTALWQTSVFSKSSLWKVTFSQIIPMESELSPGHPYGKVAVPQLILLERVASSLSRPYGKGVLPIIIPMEITGGVILHLPGFSAPIER